MFYPMINEPKFANGSRVKLRINIVNHGGKPNSIGGYSKGHEFTVISSNWNGPDPEVVDELPYYKAKREDMMNPIKDYQYDLRDDDNREIAVNEEDLKRVKTAKFKTDETHDVLLESVLKKKKTDKKATKKSRELETASVLPFTRKVS